MLTEPPFRDWTASKSYDKELGIFDIRFAEQGLDLVCDSDERLQTLFLLNQSGRRFEEAVVDCPLSCGREEVHRRLGSPDKSGRAFADPLLGPMGAWDRFARPGYAIHVQYQTATNSIGMITLMRADSVPGSS